ncbi:hypothetical protein LCGC14_1397950, partial [marine sediment metagenome]
MNLIDIFLYCTEGVFFILAIIFAYYSLARARRIKDSRGHQIIAVGALLLIIVSVIGSVDGFFFLNTRLRLAVFSVWTGALFVFIYGGLLVGKSIQRAYGSSWLKMTRWYPGSTNNLISILLLTFGAIPVYLLDILRPASGQFSWYWVSKITIWAFCFANLAFTARIQSLSGLGHSEQEEAILLRDDVLTARAYGALINAFLVAIKPFARATSEYVLAYLEHNPILFEGCKIRQDATVDFEPVVRNLERIDKKHRIQDICTIFSALASKIIHLYGAVASPKYADQVFAKIYAVTRQAFGGSPMFFYILRSLPENILSEERLALLPREELEARVQERTRELHQAREELQEAKDYTDNVIESMAEALIVVGADATIKEVNQATLDLLGYEENELVGQPIEIVLGKEEELSFEKLALHSLVKKEIARNAEGIYWSKDGRKIPVSLSSSIMRDNGKIQGFIFLARDITERKKGEEELRKSEERFRTSVENMLDCFGIYSAVRDESGRIVNFLVQYVNEAACTTNRMTKEEQIGKRLLELLPGHRKTGLFDEYCQVVETGKPFANESMVYEDVYKKKRLKRAFDIRVVKLGDGFAAAWRDITERKKAEEKIRNYQERLRSLASELTLVEEQEKRRLATELHDSIGQLLALCRIKLGELEKMTDVPDARFLVREVEERLEEIIWQTRSLTSELGPSVLYQLGLEAALEWLVEYMQEQYSVLTKVKFTGKIELADEELRVFLFRTVQELLLNVSKHAKT